MSGRTDLATMLTATLPAPWKVIDHLDSPDIAKPSVMTWVQSVEPSPANLGHWHWSIKVLVMLPKQTGADTELEAGLEEVLEAIDLWDYPINWTSASYSVYAETYPAYEVVCEMHTRREYPDDNPAPADSPTTLEEQ